MGALDTLFESVDTKLKTCSFITDVNNVTYGENPDIAGKDATFFPRIETLVVKFKCNGYADQRNLQWELRLGSAVYIRSDSYARFPTLGEMKTIAQYGKEVADKYFSFLDDKQAGLPPCVGFEKLYDYPEIFFEKELIPKTMAALIFTSIELLLPDTELL
jgi:hypothetical protein